MAISDEDDKRFQALLRAKALTFEDVFWLVCGPKCPTCDVARPTKDALARLLRLEEFARDIERNQDHTRRRESVCIDECDKAPLCLVCAATEALATGKK